MLDDFSNYFTTEQSRANLQQNHHISHHNLNASPCYPANLTLFNFIDFWSMRINGTHSPDSATTGHHVCDLLKCAGDDTENTVANHGLQTSKTFHGNSFNCQLLANSGYTDFESVIKFCMQLATLLLFQKKSMVISGLLLNKLVKFKVHSFNCFGATSNFGGQLGQVTIDTPLFP